MYKNILDILICPECRDKLKIKSKEEIDGEIIEGILGCSNGHKWVVKEGILDFGAKEQELFNNWSETYKQIDYKELDRLVTEKTPKVQQDSMEAAKIEIIDIIKKQGYKKVLDIATGRGMLLMKLAESLGSEIELTCVDLSYEVLKYDRIKTKKINPNAKINYIACDATQLPFISNAFDLSVSFFGILNMGSIMKKGILEAVRVSQKELVNTGLFIRDDNPKIDEVNKILKDNGYDYNIEMFTESNFYKAHDIDNAYKTKAYNVFEGIAEKNESDIIPIEGEWFAVSICRVYKE